MITMIRFPMRRPISLAVLLILSLNGCIDQHPPEAGSVQVVGSETVRPLADACAAAFMDKNPEADVMVRGGGSGDGVAALLHGMTDIGMSSRELTPEERQAFVAKGIELNEFDLALDGLAVIVNNSNPIGALDISQVKAMYTSAQPLNWKAFGGEAKEIIMFARGGSSGTAAVFQDKVLGDAPHSAVVHRLLDNDAVLKAVATQPNAIGYTSLAELKEENGKVRVVALKANAQAAPTLPSPEAVRAGTYPIARKLHFYTAGKPLSTVSAFISACQDMGKIGLVEKVGYVSLAEPIKK